MPVNRLNVVATEPEPKRKAVSRSDRRQESQEKFEHLWSLDPNQFNPERSARERERIKRTWNLIREKTKIENARAADLPCGWGLLSLRLQKAGAKVHAVDVSENALKHVKDLLKNECEISQACLPHTTLKEDHYDLVISTDAISYLNQDDYRLYFAELSRIINSQGFLICSTNIDIYSEDALQRFCELFETEFEIDQWSLSYHAYQIRLCNMLEAPSKFIRASKDTAYKKQEVAKRHSFDRSWFRFNSAFIPSLFWQAVNLAISPLLNWIKQNKKILLSLEKLCRFFSSDTGISHVILLGKRRPLFALPPQEAPIERKHKREVWE